MSFIFGFKIYHCDDLELSPGCHFENVTRVTLSRTTENGKFLLCPVQQISGYRVFIAQREKERKRYMKDSDNVIVWISVSFLMYHLMRSRA